MSEPFFVPVYLYGKLHSFAWVDAEDAPRVCAYKWVVCWPHAYAGRRLVRDIPPLGGISMHRFILGLARGEGVIHHVNEDPLDNRRANLKVLPDMLAHGAESHPRRNISAGPFWRENQAALPPHEREVALAAAGLLQQMQREREAVRS